MPAKYLLILACLEGATVMAVELLGAKMITPYFGSSLVVWTAVIGVTLICLTTGYFIGGRLSTRNNLPRFLFFLLLVSGLLIGSMTGFAHPILTAIGEMNVYVATVLCAFFLFGLPLIFLGATSPIIIRLITENVSESGKNAGIVYAISTVGGIFMTFFLGFFVIPNWGITIPSLLIAGTLIVANMVFLFSTRRMIFGTIFLLVVVLQGAKVLSHGQGNSTLYDIVYRSEGLLGQLKVLDEYYPEDDIWDRSMLVNGIPQTFIARNSAESYWYYVHMLSTLAKVKPAGSKVLLLGFGGGSLARELSNYGHNIDAVEIDDRMWELAQDYFQYDPVRTRFIVDDARHYINVTENKYDIIICDLLKGEVQPPYVLTEQSFRLAREKLLEPGGVFLLNFQGQVKGEMGLPYRSLLKTMDAAGYKNVYYNYANEDDVDSPADVVIVGSDQAVDFNSISADKINECCLTDYAVSNFVRTRKMFSLAEADLTDALILDDDLPVLEHLNLKSIMDWRIAMITNTTKLELQEGINIFD